FEPREAIHRSSVERDLPHLAARAPRASQDEELRRAPRAALEVDADPVPPERKPRVRGDRADLGVRLERERVEAPGALLDLVQRHRARLDLEAGPIELDLGPH